MEALILVRFVHFAATLVAGGTLWFALLVPRPTPAEFDRRLRLLAWAALALAVLSGTIWLMLVAAGILDVSFADVGLGGGAWPVVTETRFGQVWLVRSFLALLLAGLLTWGRVRRPQALLALGLVGLPALTGHAGAMPGPAGYWLVAADTAHLIAAGAWLGALPAFALMLGSARGHTAWDAWVERATRRFSQLAVVCVATLIASGLINSWHLLNGPRDLIATDYGRLLALKIVLFAAMLAIATVNRFRLTPALPAATARRALARNTLVETGLGLGVLLLVAALGTVPPGGHIHLAGAIPPDASFVHIHGADAMADVTLAPGRVTATIRVAREDFSEIPARDVRLALDPPKNAARPSSEHIAVRQPNGIWQATGIDLTPDGVWTVRVIITPETGSSFVLDAPIVIAR